MNCFKPAALTSACCVLIPSKALFRRLNLNCIWSARRHFEGEEEELPGLPEQDRGPRGQEAQGRQRGGIVPPNPGGSAMQGGAERRHPGRPWSSVVCQRSTGAYPIPAPGADAVGVVHPNHHVPTLVRIHLHTHTHTSVYAWEECALVLDSYAVQEEQRTPFAPRRTPTQGANDPRRTSHTSTWDLAWLEMT